MKTQEVWQTYGQEMYFFILKKVKNKNIANDVFQNSFLKIHKNLHQLKAEQKLRAWVFQISRNEIANYFKKESTYENPDAGIINSTLDTRQDFCCFDRFIDELPKHFREVIELTYIKGNKQEEVAEILQISLANVKARIRRSKTLLKKRFQECCKHEINKQGNLTGTPNCVSCT